MDRIAECFHTVATIAFFATPVIALLSLTAYFGFRIRRLALASFATAISPWLVFGLMYTLLWLGFGPTRPPDDAAFGAKFAFAMELLDYLALPILTIEFLSLIATGLCLLLLLRMLRDGPNRPATQQKTSGGTP